MPITPIFHTWRFGRVFPCENNKRKASCAECKIELEKTNGIKWILPFGAKAMTVKKYLCFDCTCKKLEDEGRRYRIVNNVDDIFEFRSIMTSLATRPHLSVSKDLLCRLIQGDLKAEKIAKFVSKYDLVYQSLIDDAKRVFQIIFNDSNDLKWKIGNDIYRGSTARYIHIYFMEYTGVLARWISIGGGALYAHRR